MSDDPWKSIETPPSSSGINARRVDANHRWNFFWGRDLHGRCLLVLQHSTSDAFQGKLPHLRGIELREVGQPVDALVLTLLVPAQRQIFYRLCADVVESTAQASSGMEAVRVAVRRTWRWHHLLRGAKGDLLSIDEQKGLIGELLVLERHLLPNLSAVSAVSAWRGPTGAPKDFEVGHLCIEVKSRRGAATPHILVNSEHQLDVTGIGALFLAVIDLANAPDAASDRFTISDVARRVRQTIADYDEAAVEALEATLLAAGFRWSDDYTTYGWLEIGLRIFRVDDRFPCIVPSGLPVAVSRVRYSVSLPDVVEFMIEPSEFNAAIKREGNDD